MIQIHTRFEATSAKVATESLEAWVSRTIADQVQKHPPGTVLASVVNAELVISPDSGVAVIAAVTFRPV